MKLLNLILVSLMIFSSASAVSARWLKKKKSKKITPAVVIVQPKIDPIKDPQVLARFKNAQEIKAKVASLDHLDSAALQKELSEVSTKREKQSQALNHLRQNELADIKTRKKKLQEAKAALKTEGIEANSVKGMMNKIKYIVKDTQMKQVKSDEAAVEKRVKKLNDQVTVNQMFESYLTKKVGN
ncbi:MAG: hypothetical protein HOA17_02425 [Candidatus Melainabacteria bacterium]|nr:hypothetical protein [Candidatus Melainabacteria bacterium]